MQHLEINVAWNEDFCLKLGLTGKYPSSPVCHSPPKPEISIMNTNLQRGSCVAQPEMFYS